MNSRKTYVNQRRRGGENGRERKDEKGIYVKASYSVGRAFVGGSTHSTKRKNEIRTVPNGIVRDEHCNRSSLDECQE